MNVHTHTRAHAHTHTHTRTDLLVEPADAGGVLHPGSFIVSPVLCVDLFLKPQVAEVTHCVTQGGQILQHPRLTHRLGAQAGAAAGLVRQRGK